MNYIYSTVNTIRDRYTPTSSTSNFYTTGQITPEEFVKAGDYLTNKFPTWSWAPAESPALAVSHLPADKQFLVTRNVPCHRRLDDDFAGDAGHEEAIVKDGEGMAATGDDEEGWLRTGGMVSSQGLKVKEIRTVDDAGNVGDREVVEDDDIPDMEDEEDDDAIIRDEQTEGSTSRRTYNLYIMYSPFYRTPRMYLSGYLSTGQPLQPSAMMDDIVGDYKDKTVTIENFPFLSNAKMASIHPCKHASVMKLMLDRADAALRLRRERQAKAKKLAAEGVDISSLSLNDKDKEETDEWEEVEESEASEEKAIRVDQYLVVFLKFMASVTPGIEHDFTMSI